MPALTGEAPDWRGDTTMLTQRVPRRNDRTRGSATIATALGATSWLAFTPIPARGGEADRAADVIPAPVEILFYHTDHLGSTSVTTDADGEVISETLYYPFGMQRHEDGTGSPDPYYRFSGKERDDESGLQYFGARYYISGIGRFASFDSWAENVESTGAYAYAVNNPFKFVDLEGQDPTEADEEPVTGQQTAQDVVQAAKHATQQSQEIANKTQAEATAWTAGNLAALKDPQADRSQQAQDLAVHAASAAGSAAGETAFEHFEQSKTWKAIPDGVKYGAIAPAVILAYVSAVAGGPALSAGTPEIDIPLPDTGWTISPEAEVDFGAIDPEQDIYVPKLTAGVAARNGPFSYSAKMTLDPDPAAPGPFRGDFGLGVNTPVGPVQANVGVGPKEVRGTVNLTVPTN